MRVSRTILVGAVAVVGLVAVVGGLELSGPARPSGPTLSLAKPPPPPPPSTGCAMTGGYWVCAGGEGSGAKGTPKAERKSGTPTSSSVVPTERPSPTAALEVANGLGAGPPVPHPFLIGPGKPWLAGQPEPQQRPILLMQVSAGLATAPASPTAIVLLSDWPVAGKGTVSVSVYQGDTADACSSPPLRTETATAADRDGPATWSTTFAGLRVGSYEVQATFSGKAGPMTTLCGRSFLKVVTAPGSVQ